MFVYIAPKYPTISIRYQKNVKKKKFLLSFKQNFFIDILFNGIKYIFIKPLKNKFHAKHTGSKYVLAVLE